MAEAEPTPFESRLRVRFEVLSTIDPMAKHLCIEAVISAVQDARTEGALADGKELAEVAAESKVYSSVIKALSGVSAGFARAHSNPATPQRRLSSKHLDP